jgi:uncharacterized protein involved in high-affinity Fe2+ transport
MPIRRPVPVLTLAGCAALPVIAQAGEFYVGEPIVQDNLQIVPNYLTGIKMDPMPKGMDMSPDAIHLEGMPPRMRSTASPRMRGFRI